MTTMLSTPAPPTDAQLLTLYHMCDERGLERPEAVWTCHHRVTMNQPPALRLLAESLSDAEYAYIVGKLGEGGPARLFGV